MKTIPGIDKLRPLPPELQKYTVFSAGVLTGAQAPQAARALVRFLASPDAAAVIVASGMDLIGAAARK